MSSWCVNFSRNQRKCEAADNNLQSLSSDKYSPSSDPWSIADSANMNLLLTVSLYLFRRLDCIVSPPNTTDSVVLSTHKNPVKPAVWDSFHLTVLEKRLLDAEGFHEILYKYQPTFRLLCKSFAPVLCKSGDLRILRGYQLGRIKVTKCLKNILIKSYTFQQKHSNTRGV